MIDALMAVMLLLALAGCAYLVVATLAAGQWLGRPVPVLPKDPPSVTVLKPLCGADPGLYDNLASVCRQDYPAPLQVVCGVAATRDPAIAVVERLSAEHPEWPLELVVDHVVHGANLKISNLINMAPAVRHDVIVLSDSDIRLRPGDIVQVVAALSRPNVGAVTCLYTGEGATGVWSDLAGLGITAHFLPNAIVGLLLGRARPCFGSLIALRRETLAAIGGFERFSDTLADDYALGAAVRAQGLLVEVAPPVVAHRCDEDSLQALWHHEVRWARTVMSLDPLGHIGLLVTHPLPLALLGALYGGGRPAFGLAFAAIACRVGLVLRLGRLVGVRTSSAVLVPLRDLLTFAVFVGSFLGRGVSWKERRYRMQADGAFTETDTRGRLDL